MTANRMKPDTSWGSDTSVASSSSSLINCMLSKLFCGIWNPDALSTLLEIALSSPILHMMASSPICLLSNATKTKSWLWHRHLSHLNFGAINHLARHGLVRGLPRLKFEKDHLCSACAMGKSKKQSHKPKSKDTNQEKLYFCTWIFVDLCVLQDEAPDFITKFLKMIQVRLNAAVGISHETSVAHTSQQNGVVERRNRTLVKVARTMLIYAKAPLVLWAKAVATTCYTQN
ncbi:retrovirus-related pol polyprotein from transposon TNT 1-94 [Tanacetum coccineum]